MRDDGGKVPKDEGAEMDAEAETPPPVPVMVGSLGWNSLGSVLEFDSKFQAWGRRKKWETPSRAEIEFEGVRCIHEFFKNYEYTGGEDPNEQPPLRQAIPPDIISLVDLLCFKDPHNVSNRRHHIGLNIDLLKGMFPVDDYQTEESRQNWEHLRAILSKLAWWLAQHVEAKTPLYIFFYCTSGRHRSVLFANLLRLILRYLKRWLKFWRWTHLCKFFWRAVKCQHKNFGEEGTPECWYCRADGWLEDDVARQIVERCVAILESDFTMEMEA